MLRRPPLFLSFVELDPNHLKFVGREQELVTMAELAASIAQLVPTLGGLIASAAPTHRQCTVEIENATKSYSFENPSVYLEHGYCDKSLPFEVNPGTTHDAIFTKIGHTATGCVGVFTYDLSRAGSSTNNKIAVMFSVPYDFNLFSNWFAVGVYSRDKKCDQHLYNEMYNNEKQSGFVRRKAAECFLKYQHKDIVIDASMTDSHVPYLKVRFQKK